jgi:hypothetical protein
MDELEQQLRSVLTEMAEGVPPSRNAWAEHEHRLAVKSRRAKRRPVLMAAAAAAAVALIAVPMLITGVRPDKKPELQQADSSSAPSLPRSKPTEASPVYQPQSGETVLTQPFILVTERVNNVDQVTYAYTVRRQGLATLCFSRRPASDGLLLDGSSPDYDPQCFAMGQPLPGKVFWLHREVTTPDTAGVYVFVASSPTERVMVRTAEQQYIIAGRRQACAEFGVFSVVVGSNQPLVAYTAQGPGPAYAQLENG